jgi:hypothetical protein
LWDAAGVLVIASSGSSTAACRWPLDTSLPKDREARLESSFGSRTGTKCERRLEQHSISSTEASAAKPVGSRSSGVPGSSMSSPSSNAMRVFLAMVGAASCARRNPQRDGRARQTETTMLLEGAGFRMLTPTNRHGLVMATSAWRPRSSKLVVVTSNAGSALSSALR